MALWRRSRGRHAPGAPPRAVPSYDVLPTAAPPAAEPDRGPRVELTFRDGSSAALSGESARALDEIAQLLTGRAGVKR